MLRHLEDNGSAGLVWYTQYDAQQTLFFNHTMGKIKGTDNNQISQALIPFQVVVHRIHDRFSLPLHTCTHALGAQPSCLTHGMSCELASERPLQQREPPAIVCGNISIYIHWHLAIATHFIYYQVLLFITLECHLVMPACKPCQNFLHQPTLWRERPVLHDSWDSFCESLDRQCPICWIAWRNVRKYPSRNYRNHRRDGFEIEWRMLTPSELQLSCYINEQRWEDATSDIYLQHVPDFPEGIIHWSDLF